MQKQQPEQQLETQQSEKKEQQTLDEKIKKIKEYYKVIPYKRIKTNF
jgi:hypothetical protein